MVVLLVFSTVTIFGAVSDDRSGMYESSIETSGDFEYTVLDDGTAEITEYKGNEEILLIPSEIDGHTVIS